MNHRVCFTWAICALLGTDVGAKLVVDGLWTGSVSLSNASSKRTDAKRLPLYRGSDRGVSSEHSSDIETGSAVPHPAPNVAPRNADDAAGGGQPPQEVDHPLNRVTSVMAAPVSKRSEVEVRSALLKNHDGVKITGTCNAKFQLFLVPHISISVEAESNTIQLGRKLEVVTITKKQHKVVGSKSSPLLQFEEDEKFLLNQCAEGKAFKFVVIVKGEELILKWKVYEREPSATDNNKVDVRKYVLRNLGSPITSIQVHSGKEDNDVFLLESKAYLLRQDIPKTCERIATNCFLSGNVDIEGCFKCTLLWENTKLGSPCFSYLPPDVKHNYEQIKMKAQDEGDKEEAQLDEFIRRVLQMVQKMEKNNTPRKGKNKGDYPNDNLKELLLSYCQMMKKVDTSGTLEEHELGNEVDVLTNLEGLLRKHSNEEIAVLREKLKNPAICMKDADMWIVQKRGLALPTFEYKHLQRRRVTTPVDSKEDNKETDRRNVIKDMYIPGYRAVIDLSQKSEMNHSNPSGEMFCNEDYCDRWKDKNSCFSSIETEEQGNCNLSWLFASKTHLETIRCMKGYDHLGSSALYVANCSKRGNKSKCTSGSNPYEFLTIVEENGFLPPALLIPYSYADVGNGCPRKENHWQNLWANVKLLEPSDEPNSVSTKGYTSYESDDFRGNIDVFIDLVKREVRGKGSVMAYVKALGVLGYNMNGKEVHSLCGDKRPDHAVNIIGYGNYINTQGLKKSYWLVRNSWGKYWGDEGNFKVDMHGPADCQHNFIHTAAVFNLHVPMSEGPSKREAHLYNYYLKSSPDFLGNIYYKNIRRMSGVAEKGRTGRHQSLAVQGQEGQSDLLEGSTPSGTANQVDEPKGAREDAPKRGDQGKCMSEDPPIEVVNEELISESTLTLIPQAARREGQVEANPAPPLTVAASLPLRGDVLLVRDGTDEGSTEAATVEVLHILKHIKHGKVKLGIVTYGDESDISGDHSCSRSLAQDSEQLTECIQFCHNEWPNCRDEASPGYCLAQRRKTGDCFFCYV
ncbi:serine-repeat antigen [Plasmodium cynomolgi strain B]|uniref:Serine-repeat antigen n=2 Tax=Plasmodium cynomolgi TaxID=5827 RepID=K6V7F2_PLACD|nr:serine-repeat antigen [Plasmodium cynomolgi strain B]BAK08399.1 putative papain-like cysteine prorease [Plasmodium cynomolgi]GAB65017.1 serine-repeat antigen [Plasmodium cynomolgi strain B]